MPRMLHNFKKRKKKNEKLLRFIRVHHFHFTQNTSKSIDMFSTLDFTKCKKQKFNGRNTHQVAKEMMIIRFFLLRSFFHEKKWNFKFHHRPNVTHTRMNYFVESGVACEHIFSVFQGVRLCVEPANLHFHSTAIHCKST